MQFISENWLLISIVLGLVLATVKAGVAAWKAYAATTPSLEDDASAAKAEEIVNKVESAVDKAKSIIAPKPKV